MLGDYSNRECGMVVDFSAIGYLVIGFLLGNGVPHFVFGRAGKIFRSPFGQKSEPRVNVLWGLANFVAATIVAIGLLVVNAFNNTSLLFLLAGFWLAMLFFGQGIKRFLSE